MTLNPTALLDGTATEIRAGLIRYLVDRHDIHAATSGTIVEDDLGAVSAQTVAVGPERFVAALRATDGNRLSRLQLDLEDYWSFQEFEHRDRTQEAQTLVDTFWAPHGLDGVIATNVAVDGHYLGHVALYRHETSAPYTPALLRRVNADLGLVREVLLIASARGRFDGPIGGSYVIDSQGHLLFAQGEGDGSNALRNAAQQFLCLGGPSEVLIGESLVSLSRLDGQSGPAALASVRLARTSMVPEIMRLTKLKREIATFAARGATAAEIASATGRKPETIRAHLREIYARLGVASRVELAELVDRAWAKGSP